jgi:hypothetical protein
VDPLTPVSLQEHEVVPENSEAILNLAMTDVNSRRLVRQSLLLLKHVPGHSNIGKKSHLP